MIHIFGDSWGYSYKCAVRDEFDGVDLAGYLSNRIQTTVINHCERGLSNFTILNNLHSKLKELSSDDIVIVLQTDPLRNVFVPWHRNKSQKIDDNQLTLDTTMDMAQIYHYLLINHYTKLKELNNQTNAKIILHGGCSKLNTQLAEEFNLIYTKKSSTEILVPDYQDCYYFDDTYIAWVVRFLTKNNKNYKDVPSVVLEIIAQTQKKMRVWQEHDDLFTRHHTTPQGTNIVADYLADFLKARLYI
jgi:hypothetical protein